MPQLKNTSTRTFDGGRRRIALAAAAVLGLAACDGGGFGTSPARDITVSRSAVTIQGPRGFCVDPRATKDTEAQAFVLLGNCAALSRSARVAQPEIRALLTAVVRENPGAPLATQLALAEEYLRSPDGRALLSRSGRSDSVKILDSFAQGDVLFLHVRDTAEGYAPDMATDYWRAVFDLDGAILSVAVLGFNDEPLSREAGLGALEDFSRIIQRRNQDPAGSGARG